MSAEMDLRAHLRALDEAEETDPSRAFRLRAELVRQRLLERVEDVTKRATELDIGLLFRLGRDLVDLGFYEEALVALSAARAHAAEARDSRWSERLAVHGALASIALIDCDSAESVLRDLLHVNADVPLSDKRVIDAVMGLDRHEPGGPHGHTVTVEAIYAIGRLLAARGDLLSARQVLTTALAHANQHPSPWISTSDLALFLAEVTIDAGDYDEAAALAAHWSQSRAPRRTRLAWRVLLGTLHYGRGELSSADRCFRELEGEAITHLSEGVIRSAQWQRAQILILLNRLDEAEELIDGLSHPGREEAESLRSLIEIRRGHSDSLQSPPSPREILAIPVGRELPPVGHSRSDSATPSAVRTRERVRDEWARRANAVLMALQRGHQDLALRQFALLAGWTPGLSSPLIHARYNHLKALVAYSLGGFEEAKIMAQKAIEDFRSLSLLVDEWSAIRMLFWSLKQSGAPMSELDIVAMRSRRALKAIQGRLTPIDRVFHQLNKWTAVDDAISAWTQELRKRAHNGKRSPKEIARAIHRIAVVKSWDTLLQHSPTEPEESDQPPPGTDVFGWARERLHARRQLPGIAGYDLPFLTRWIPRDVAVVHHVVLPERVEVFLIQRGGVACLDLPQTPTRPALMEIVHHALRELAQEKAWNPTSPALAALVQALGVAEIDRTLDPQVRRLFFVADDTIVHVPFAALPLRGLPLVATFESCMLPHQRWISREAARRTRFGKGLAVAVSRSSAEPDYDPLGHPADEIEGLAAVCKRGAVVLQNESARRERVTEQLQEVRAAHFACHGEFRFDDPMDTGLLMHDGWFTVRDLKHLDLTRLDLVVAAACFGADMKVLPGRELVSLPAALIEAGVRAVVAPLWELFEESSVPGRGGNPTAAFFREMYACMARRGAASSLAEVQRQWASNRPTSDWAGYQIFVGGISPIRPLRWLLPLFRAWRSVGLSRRWRVHS